MNQILAEGAEAKIIKINNSTLKKIREKKPYRLDEIDIKLRKSRNRKEFKILKKLEELNINAPKAFKIFEIKNKETKKFEEISFTFEFLDGNLLKEVINLELLRKTFGEIIKIHKNDIIHGDLTTLNIIVKNNEIFLIDFGLGEISNKIEDKAVDLNLFFTSIKNEHQNLFKYKKELLEKYLKSISKGNEIIKRLEKIEIRGRNK